MRDERPSWFLSTPRNLHPPVVVGDQPGDGPLDHRSPSSVVLGERHPLSTPGGTHQLTVMRMEPKGPAGLGGGAPLTEWTSPTAHTEYGPTA